MFSDPKIKQAFYSLGVILNMVCHGMVIAYPGTLIPALKKESTFGIGNQITDRITTLIASVPGLSGLIPVILLGPLMHVYGRKVANICMTTPIVCGWILAYFSTNSIYLLIAARFLQGLVVGLPYFISVCIGELSSPKMRSILLNMKPIANTLGVAIIHIAGGTVNWRDLALIGAIPSTLALFITFYWPDTPEWLASRGKFERAEKVFFDIRGRTPEGAKEIRQLIEAERNRQEFNAAQKKSILKNMKSRVLWKPVSLLFCAVLVPTMGGRQYIPSYSIQLASQLSGDNTKGFLYTVVVDVIGLIASLFTIYFLRVMSRRRLLFSTGYLGSALLALSAGLLYARTVSSNTILTWCNLVTFALYYCIVNMGAFSVSYILMGELFPLEYRAVGSVIDGVLGSLGTGVAIGIMPILEKSCGTHGMFLVFGGVMVASLTYLYFELPETKDRTLHDIGDYFRGKSPKIRKPEISKNEENTLIMNS